MPYDIEIVTDALLYECRARHVSVSNLMLQKLLYYAQAWHLVFYGPLFSEPIEAWVHGPVVPCVFRRFRDLRWDPIDNAGEKAKHAQLAKFLKMIVEKYGKFSAKQLERLTHSESPWINARAGLAFDEPSHAVISHADMRRYFAGILQKRA